MSFTIEVSSPWFEYIRSGQKTIEGRKGTPRWLQIQPGMKGWVVHPQTNERFLVLCQDVRKYPGLRDYLVTETLEKTLPGISSIEEGMRIYLQWSTEEEIAFYGFLAIEILRI